MRRSRASDGRRARLLACACLLALATAALLLWRVGASGVSRAAGEPSSADTAQTDASVPAREVTMIGATPAEAGGGRDETWGIGHGSVVVRYARNQEGEGGWSLGPGLRDEAGQPLSGFELDKPQASSATAAPSPLAGQLTPDGAGVLAGFVGATQVLLVRDPGSPGNAFRETKPVPESDLEHGEKMFGFTKAPLIAPLDEGGGHAGALVVPVIEGGSGGEQWVLHWDGVTQEWTREPIEKPKGANPSEFRVLGIGASAPGNAWLIAQLTSGHVGLFRRHVAGSESPTWRPAALKAGGEPGEPLMVKNEGNSEPLTIPGEDTESVEAQVLTVTEQAVWVDGERAAARASTTLFVRPNGEGQGLSITSWCTPQAPGAFPCDKTLPDPLPTGPSRSLAWTSSSAYGERIIAGLPGGVSLRLEGQAFNPVLSLGEGAGTDYGAAFSNPHEGWLGEALLPVHLTGAPAPSRLTPWPTAFRRALIAAASQPRAPAGALSTSAVAVGDLGEVARYQPGQGWLPESLLGAGGRVEKPELRAVAWPTPTRIYAVGDCQSAQACVAQMWLWRGETGLWEPDPAAPVNFRGNLLGVAFDPNDPARGYAVGESGVLLRYGKSWSQDQYPAEHPCSPRNAANAEESQRCSTWTDASFTSIAFAGSQAIVAYRVLPNRSSNQYDGGLIVNSGSGWHIDAEATAVMGSHVPWAVGGLADGGAAFAASGSVFEREGPGPGWHAAAVPFPGGGEPGSLALFREGGALRVIASGSAPDTIHAESAPEAPPGFPPTLVPPYPLSSNGERAVIHQTATGWSDEEHELNDARAPAGNWTRYDTPYAADPIAAVLVDPSGSQGWAVGGTVEPEQQHHGVLDTAEIARYRDTSAAPGVGTYTISTAPPPGHSPLATFAIGGNAGCSARCAELANAGIGPDVWLSAALARASAIPGVRSFFYTGARVADPRNPNVIEGHIESADRISYPSEFGRYAEILGNKGVAGYAVATPSDLDEAGSELSFKNTFSGDPFAAACPGCQSAYYAVEPPGSGGPVRVIVLDDTAEVDPTQRAWLEGQLAEAKSLGHPAIAVGNADLSAQIAEGNHPGAQEVARILVQGGASAYFFDSPEENVKKRLEYRGESIEAFGSGTLGYVSFQGEESGAFLGASGFLLAQVDVAVRDPRTNRAPVLPPRLIPNVGELAMEAKDGLILPRSKAALFGALARRPLAGNRSPRGQVVPDTDPYIPIPANCVGASCSTGIFPEYTFSSSNPKIGDFVKPNLASPDPHAVELVKVGNNEQPIPDPQSGLFCAYNAGTTLVTISAGGLSYSLPVTVQAGSVRRPCGTTPLEEEPAASASTPVPSPAPTPAPTPAGSVAPTPVPLPPAPAAPAAPAPPAAVPAPHPQPPPFLPPPAPTASLIAALPPPLPTPARPTPPSGTSAVTQPVEAPEKEEEQEEAPESVSNKAVAYRASENEPYGAYLIGVVVLAAFAGACVRRRPPRDVREVRIAPATISTTRAQRDSTGRRRRW